MENIDITQPVSLGWQPQKIELALDETKETLDVLVSSEKKNRMGMIVLNTAFGKMSNFKRQPVLMDSHDRMNRGLGAIVGRWSNMRVTERGLEGRAHYFTDIPEGERAFYLAKKGLAAFSVGFNVVKAIVGEEEIKDSKELSSKIKKQQPFVVVTALDLLEITQCCIPQNAEAVNEFIAGQDDKEGVRDLVQLAVEKGFYETEPEITENITDVSAEVARMNAEHVRALLISKRVKALGTKDSDYISDLWK